LLASPRFAELNPHRLDYIRFFHLRAYDRINAPASYIKQAEEQTGIKLSQAQVALARRWIGDLSQGICQKTIKIGKSVSGQRDRPDENTQSGGALGFGGPGGFGIFGGEKKAPTPKEDPNVEVVPVPASEEESQQIIDRFERGARGVRSDVQVSDSVAQHALQDKTRLQDEKWLGTEAEEKAWSVHISRSRL
jgi:phospholipase D1/2